ncbi:MAG: hypothetical protein M3Q07_16870 [Pseudobdellovibrionaceae bacterium]|nr:hypothetical protein [Pseudobdellovibrionaceae bacterium]
MHHKLIDPFEFEGRSYTEVQLDDKVKVKHNMASLRVSKLAADLEKSGISLGQSLEDTSIDDVIRYAEFKSEADRLMFEAFCGNFPAAAIGELSDEDKDLIDAHIQKVMEENNRRKAGTGQPPEKKRIQPVRSGS